MTAEIRSFFESYGEGGRDEAVFEECRLIGQHGDFAVADLCGTIRRKAGKESWRWRTNFNRRRDEGKWKILMNTAYEGKRFCNEGHAS